jgi:hypothetical protein
MLGGGGEERKREWGRRGEEICTSPHRFERIERMKDFFEVGSHSLSNRVDD